MRGVAQERERERERKSRRCRTTADYVVTVCTPYCCTRSTSRVETGKGRKRVEKSQRCHVCSACAVRLAPSLVLLFGLGLGYKQQAAAAAVERGRERHTHSACIRGRPLFSSSPSAVGKEQHLVLCLCECVCVSTHTSSFFKKKKKRLSSFSFTLVCASHHNLRQRDRDKISSSVVTKFAILLFHYQIATLPPSPH